jgi:hypothetical protein
MKQKDLSLQSLGRIALAGMGAVLVGAIGSGVWDVVAKPGLSRIAVGILTVITFGSETVRDLPYASAALNPFPLPTLLLLGVMVLAIPALIVYVLFETFVKPRLRRRRQEQAERIRAAADTPDNGEIAVARWRTTRFYFAAIVLAVYLSLIFGFAYASFAVVNQAVLVRRVFEANFDIVAPHISVDERLRIRSEFAQMTNRADWNALNSKLGGIAKSAGVTLRQEIIR